MTPAERPYFATLMAVLADTWDRRVSTTALEGYWMGLEDVPLSAVKTAVRIALQTAQFFPSPGELRRLAGWGDPDAGWLESQLQAHLAQPGGERRRPASPFLRLIVERLGGWLAVVSMPAAVRVGLLAKILGPALVAARQQGITVPPPSHPLPLAAVASTQLDQTDPRDRTVPVVVQTAVREVLRAR